MSTFIPAYKDTYYETTASALSFYVMTDERVVFEGKALKSPNEAKLRININRIAKDYLEHSMPEYFMNPYVRGLFEHPQAFKFFELYSADGTLLETYGVLFDWEGTFNGETKVLSDPIKNSISANMKMPFSVFSLEGDTMLIEFGPAVHNTFFTLLTDSLSISNGGGSYSVDWLTDYYPFTNIHFTSNIGAIQSYGQRGPSGATITFKAAPSPAPRTFDVTVYYGDTGTTLGTIEVLQSSTDFNLLTKTLYVGSSGGTFQIRWVTAADPQDITASASGWPGTTVDNISTSGCTVTIPQNPFPNEYPFDVSFYFEWSGTSYYLDSTQVHLSGYAGKTSGDTGNTGYALVDSAVTRDVLITQDGAFASFGSPAIIVVTNVGQDGIGFYPYGDDQYYSNLLDTSGVGSGLFKNNISASRKTEICATTAATSRAIWEVEGVVLSGSTGWLNDYLSASSGTPCEKNGLEQYSGETRSGVLYIVSGGTVLDSVVVIEKAYSSVPRQGYNIVADSSLTPYQFSDLKFKSTGFTESEVRGILAASIPLTTDYNVWDGVKAPSKRAVYDSGNSDRYSTSAFTLTTDENGWTTVKTPLPINDIVLSQALPATEIWLSKNVKSVWATPSSNITAVTYEGTKQDFRNVYIIGNTFSNVSAVTCSDGVSYGIKTLRGKSDPVLYIGNNVRPSFEDEYFYLTNDPTPSNTVTITFTGSTVPSAQYTANSYFYGIDNQLLSIVSYETGMTGEYATLTLTFDDDVYWLVDGSSSWRSISDTIRYYAVRQTRLSNIAEPMTNMRVDIEGSLYRGNTNLPAEIEFTNLRALMGSNNFSGSTVTTLKVPNLITITDSALTRSTIEEVYAPSLQFINYAPFPSTLKKLTVGKNLNGIGQSAFSNCTLLKDLYFTGTVAEWNKIDRMATINLNQGGDFTRLITNYSNIETIWCSDGEIHITRE